jgi:hypothetical protein
MIRTTYGEFQNSNTIIPQGNLTSYNEIKQHILTPWSRVLLEKLNSSLLWHSQVPTTSPILNQFDPVHTTTFHFL